MKSFSLLRFATRAPLGSKIEDKFCSPSEIREGVGKMAVSRFQGQLRTQSVIYFRSIDQILDADSVQIGHNQIAIPPPPRILPFRSYSDEADTCGRTSLPLCLVLHCRATGHHRLLRRRVTAERVRVVVAVAVVGHLGLLGTVVVGRHDGRKPQPRRTPAPGKLLRAACLTSGHSLINLSVRDNQCTGVEQHRDCLRPPT